MDGRHLTPGGTVLTWVTGSLGKMRNDKAAATAVEEERQEAEGGVGLSADPAAGDLDGRHLNPAPSSPRRFTLSEEADKEGLGGRHLTPGGAALVWAAGTLGKMRKEKGEHDAPDTNTAAERRFTTRSEPEKSSLDGRHLTPGGAALSWATGHLNVIRKKRAEEAKQEPRFSLTAQPEPGSLGPRHLTPGGAALIWAAGSLNMMRKERDGDAPVSDAPPPPPQVELDEGDSDEDDDFGEPPPIDDLGDLPSSDDDEGGA
jgi:hypothetical protein